MMGLLHQNSRSGYTTLTTLLAFAVIGIGLSAGLIVTQLDNPQTSASQADENSPFVNYVSNADIGIAINGPTKPGTWDYAINGSLCFKVNPPSANGKYRIELRLPTRDNTDGEVIGASVSKLVTNPATMKCTPEGRVRRDPAYTAVFNIPEKTDWLEACPEVEVHVTTDGNWKPHPSSSLVAKLDRSFLCPDGVPQPTTPPSQPTSPPQPSVSPSQSKPIKLPSQAPRQPDGSEITGHISTFSCTTPESVIVTVCNESDTKCIDVPFADGPTSHGVWLEDTLSDRSYQYKYSVSKDPDGGNIQSGKEYTVRKAFARIESHNSENGVQTFDTDKRDEQTLTAPDTYDFTIDASNETCSCTFRAKAYVKDAETGQITDVLDSSSKNLTNGIANELQVIKSDTPQLGFDGGEADTGTIDFWKVRQNKDVDFAYGPYGIDGQAYVRLYAPDYNVVKQECKSSGETHGCPAERPSYENTNFANGDAGKDFKGFRIACGANVEYGWVIEEKPESEKPSNQRNPGNPGTPDPQPTPPSSADLSQEALLAEREGFARNVTGGLNGREIVVSRFDDPDTENPPEGTLRWAAQLDEPAIITFARDGEIRLHKELKVETNKTIDGRGHRVSITGKGLKVRNEKNVIITNIIIGNGTGDGEDAIELRGDDTDGIWIHQVHLFGFPDGLIDVVEGARNITVSWSILERQGKAMLVGNGKHSDKDENITVTMHHNVIRDYGFRGPTLRDGYVDMYNNYLARWGDVNSGSKVSSGGQILSEANIFEAKVSKEAIRITDGESAYKSIGNLALNGAELKENNRDDVRDRSYPANIERADDSLKNKLLSRAGIRLYTGGAGARPSAADPADSLLSEREGFGSNATGGYTGEASFGITSGVTELVVTSLADSKDNPAQGTLRWALAQPGSNVIKFDVDGIIRLEEPLSVQSNTTIDGRDRNITIVNHGLDIAGTGDNPVQNVIVTNLTIKDGEDDAIQVSRAENVWIHHITAANFTDGLIDIVRGSKNVTVSWSRLENHDKAMLISNDDSKYAAIDKDITVTIHHNVFSNTEIRTPKLRFGKVDMYNNYTVGWRGSAVAVELGGQIINEANIFEPGGKDRVVSISEKEGFVRNSNNLLLGSAFVTDNQPELVFARPYGATIEPANNELKNKLLSQAGALSPSFYEQQFGGAAFDTDLNNDGITNTLDLVLCISEYGTQNDNAACDVDNNGIVNAIDYSAVVSELETS